MTIMTTLDVHQVYFFDVIEHYFEDQFLVIKYYKEYGDSSTREEITYIPSVNISKFVIYLDEQCYNERY